MNRAPFYVLASLVAWAGASFVLLFWINENRRDPALRGIALAGVMLVALALVALHRGRVL